MRRIPCLDGIRAISIALVIFAHGYSSYVGESPGGLFLIPGNGSLGVEAFFVLSGFLITQLLLREQDTTGTVSLRAFYLRRLLRIVPPFYLYLAVIAGLGAYRLVDVPPRDLLTAATFTWDYAPLARTPSLLHTWSLSVEEQFYLLWPPLLVLALRWDRRWAAAIATSLIALAPVSRLVTDLLRGGTGSDRLYFMLHTRADALMFGCLAALMLGSPAVRAIARWKGRWLLPPAVFTCMVSPFLTHWLGGAYIYLLGFTLDGASIALCILWVTHNPRSLAGRLLEWRPLVHAGVISYGLYIWQGLFMSGGIESITGRFPINLICTVLAAETSYFVLERPLARLRKRLEGGAPRSGAAVTVAARAV